MRATLKYSLIILAFSLSVGNVMAEKFVDSGKKAPAKSKGSKAMDCAPATAKIDMDINNVRARIMTGGDMWWDLQGMAQYEIPKGSEKTSMFSASLWMAGEDINGQLKCAAQRFRGSGNDFWPGPLSTDGLASIDAETCAAYDKFFVSYKSDVVKFLAWRNGDLPDFVVPEYFYTYPAHGDISKKESKYLAPFFDTNHDGEYNPEDGDYPYYDLENEMCGKQAIITAEGNGILVDQVLKGDQTLWWVFNDKGNVHTETNGQALGMEIRAQAFAFATNDEINNMTFYTYELINRSTYELTGTYFSQWVDTDLGDPTDDFVGCDVPRGLGYCYNGKAIDGSGREQDYGDQPPAIGVDFFQGPYMNPDDCDNPKWKGSNKHGPTFDGKCDIVGLDGKDFVMEYQIVINEDEGIYNAAIDTFKVQSEAINGINFGDGIVDNERFGMRRFVYHNNERGVMGDPGTAIEYYNYLRGIWKKGTRMQYGGNGHPISGAYGDECDFMFPDETDICDWGTKGVKQSPKKWTEETANNVPADRRFMQSAGPFTLEAGAVNYITVGIPWARATSGGPFASVNLLRKVDDKCQALFDNCFKVLDGPDSPDMTIRELDKELIIYLSNPNYSNNKNEEYTEFDPTIVEMLVTNSIGYTKDTMYIQDSLSLDSSMFIYFSSDTIYDTVQFDRYYRFEGYQIYQLRNADISISEIEDPDKARLVAQCDLENDYATIVNFEFDESINASIPVVKVEGENEGVIHSFQVTQDLFATEDRKLINNKQYYFIAIAYSKNEFMVYSQSSAGQVPGISGLEGQTLVYLAGRKTADGASIPVITAIPHISSSEKYGNILNTEYGFQPKITRIEGQGNGGNTLEFVESVFDDIFSNSTFSANQPRYENGEGPINVKIIDPLNISKDSFLLKFYAPGNIDTARWILVNADTPSIVYDTANYNITTQNEQIFTDLGFSITIKQMLWETFYGDVDESATDQAAIDNIFKFEILDASVEYEDSTNKWLMGLSDVDGSSYLDWIRAGSVDNTDDNIKSDKHYQCKVGNENKYFIDADEVFENILEGTWAPYTLCSHTDYGPNQVGQASYDKPGSNYYNELTELASVDIVFTDDKSKWTRCPIIEMCEESILSEGNADKWNLRTAQSVNKDGNADGSGTGMGWFPGYVINVETGERLCVIFGEDSWLAGENGRDMLFNPTSSYNDFSNMLIGGKHWLYILKHKNYDPAGATAYDIPAYTGEASADIIRERVSNSSKLIEGFKFFQSIMWVGMPMPFANADFLDNGNDARVRIRIAKPYGRYFSTYGDGTNNPINNDYPTYAFSTKGLKTIKNDAKTAKTAMDYINVVPNPYYAYSTYDQDQLDNRIRITNLPTECTVSIYTINGTLIRQFKVDKSGVPDLRDFDSGDTEDFDFKTSIDWDLKNNSGVPISGGVYLIHVKAEGVGERVIKWFGILRPTDLNAY